MKRFSRNFKISLLIPVLVCVCSLVVHDTARTQPAKRHEFSQRQMGTLFRIVLYAPSDSLAGAAAEAAFDRIEELDTILSDYKADSELNRLSRTSGSGKSVRVSAPLFYVLKKAQDVSRKTNGAFDVTVGPFVSLWRNMQERENPQLPSEEELASARNKVGYRHIRLDRKNRTVKLTEPGMQLDLGGIAKGYALDEALRILKVHRIHSALIDGGGDVVLGDAPPERRGWNIEVTTHGRSGAVGRFMLALENRAVATSGDFYQHIEIEGTRYSHIIDPETGLGLTDRSQVTVVAPDGISADGYASAVSVLGPDNGIDLIEEMPGMEVYIERNADVTVERWESSGLEKLRTHEN